MPRDPGDVSENPPRLRGFGPLCQDERRASKVVETGDPVNASVVILIAYPPSRVGLGELFVAWSILL